MIWNIYRQCSAEMTPVSSRCRYPPPRQSSTWISWFSSLLSSYATNSSQPASGLAGQRSLKREDFKKFFLLISLWPAEPGSLRPCLCWKATWAAILATVEPSTQTRMFSGLISVWMIPHTLWRYDSPCSTCQSVSQTSSMKKEEGGEGEWGWVVSRQ